MLVVVVVVLWKILSSPAVGKISYESKSSVATPTPMEYIRFDGQKISFAYENKYDLRAIGTTDNPEVDNCGEVFINSQFQEECRIPNTAVPANILKQKQSAIHVTHYFDVKRICRDCGSLFIFFAEEQKFRYEELGFPVNSDSILCSACRKI